jgi:hypothetical protein
MASAERMVEVIAVFNNYKRLWRIELSPVVNG